ncbi:MAG: hypothetical protein GX640_10560 [Fibrobacter sp.]|nr:hypothetical protein [Fibrobacter sp.]
MNSLKHKRILGECVDFLANNRVPVSKDLLKLIEYFFSTDNHLSLSDIADYARRNKLDVSVEATKNLFRLLVEYGFAIEKIFGDNVTRYEHLHFGEHHDHFFCIKCGKIIEFCSPLIEDAQIKEANNIGFHAFSHKMQIHGLCKNCFGKSSRVPLSLSMVESGGKFTVVEIVKSSSNSRTDVMKLRLQNMGLVVGSKGEVISNHRGRIVLIVSGARLAIQAELSRQIMVELSN